MKIIVLAGGGGLRLWPLSTKEIPKQFAKIDIYSPSLFQQTIIRSKKIVDNSNIYIVTSHSYQDLIAQQLIEINTEIPKTNILCEPSRKNTLAAIYFGVNQIIQSGHDTILVFPSDHIIKHEIKFAEIIKEIESFSRNFIITFGVVPTNPNTGYGYISPGYKIKDIFKVNRFIEKPTFEIAQEYIVKGYYWNSGIFMFNSSLFVDEVEKFASNIVESFKCNSLEQTYEKITFPISIDKGLLEKSNQVAVVPVDIGWSDLGTFDSMYEVFEHDNNGNFTTNEIHSFESKGSLFLNNESGKKIVAIGIKDLIIVNTTEAILVCKKGESQNVKLFAEKFND